MLYYNDAIQKVETLQIIRYMESNNGRNTKHASDAYGSFGIKPNTALELGYHINEKNESEVAGKLYDKLAVIAKGNTDAIVYGWLKGEYGLKRQYNKPLYYRPLGSHWHVRKYRRYLTYYLVFNNDINVLFNSFVAS
ncbi:MAG: hypothetical protein ACOYOV_00375 [Bacteroidales bacterium]